MAYTYGDTYAADIYQTSKEEKAKDIQKGLFWSF